MEYLNEHAWLLALAIALARVGDVTLGTIRTIAVFRGYRLLAAGLGFCETLIWLAAAAQVFQNLDRWYLGVAYAGGFGLGNYVGCWVEGRLAVGYELVRIVSPDRQVHLAEALRESGFDTIELQGRNGSASSVEVLLAVEPRRRVPALLGLVQRTDPRALWTISDVRRRAEATPPAIQRWVVGSRWRLALRK